MTNSPIRVAQLGVGYWGKNLARNFSEIGALVAVAELDEELARTASQSLGVPAAGFDSLLADPDIDAISIATRAESHFEYANRALDAGKHVFVEKPLVLDPAEADLLIAKANSKNLVLMVGHLLRYHPKFNQMLQIVKSEKYGKLCYVTSERMSLGKIRTEENVLWSFAPHDISMVLALTEESPSSISAQGTALVNPAIEDIATAQFRFPSGVGGEIRTSWYSYKKLQKIVAICETATIVFEDSEAEWDKKLSIHPITIETKNDLPVPVRGEVEFPLIPIAEPLKLECQHFVDAIANGTQPRSDGEEGKCVLQCLQAAQSAMERSKHEGEFK